MKSIKQDEFNRNLAKSFITTDSNFSVVTPDNPIHAHRDFVRKNVLATFSSDGLNVAKNLEKAIKQDNKEKGIQYNVTDLDKLEKGAIADKLSFGYGSGNEAFKFSKTGKELKAMLPTIVAKLEVKKSIMETKMATLVATCGSEPTEEYNGGSFNLSFKRYPYAMYQTTYDELSRKYETPTDAQTACSQYNDLCYQLRDIMEDVLTAKVIMENAQDNKSYTLTVSQLVALGMFGAKDIFDKAIGIEKDTLEKGIADEKQVIKKAIGDCVNLEDVINSGYKIYTPLTVEKFQQDLRKSFDGEEIDYAEWQAQLQPVLKLTKMMIKGEEGEDLTIFVGE